MVRRGNRTKVRGRQTEAVTETNREANRMKEVRYRTINRGRVRVLVGGAGEIDR